MTTDKLPEVSKGSEDSKESVGPAIHSSAEQAIKNSAIESESKGGRKIKFIPKSRSARVSVAVAGLLGVVLILLLIVMVMSGGGSNSNTNSANTSQPVEVKDLDPDNNSEGYSQSATADFGSYSLNLGLTQPELIKSASFEGILGDQISWDDGFVILAASIDRDYRPASEFSYKKIAETGDELVRVNFLIGNASTEIMPIGYNDLALYASAPDMENTESERISEDTYSPRDGETLGSKQSKKVSLHFRVKRGQQFSIVKTKTFSQMSAKVKEGEEKKPVLSLKINL